MKCGHPESELRKSFHGGYVELKCRACHRDYMRIRRAKEKRESVRNWQHRKEIKVYRELASRPWNG